MSNVSNLIENFVKEMSKFEIKVMEIHVNNLDKLRLHFVNDHNPKVRINKGDKDLYYGITDFDTLRLVNKEWWIEYCYNHNMSRRDYFSWRPSYKNLLKFDNPIAVEVGVLEGFNSKLALSFIDFEKYYLVDPYKEYEHKDLGQLDKINQKEWDNIYNKVIERFSNEKNVEIKRKTSIEASKDFKDESVDFVYLDGDHSREGVLLDLRSWFPKVKKGGYIAGHDVENDNVKSSVYEFFLEKYGDKVSPELISIIVDSEFNDWWIRKL